MGSSLVSDDGGSESREETLLDLFASTVARNGERAALTTKRPHGWVSVSFAEWSARARLAASALAARGVQHGDRVVLFADNRDEWVVADTALALLGAIGVPLHPVVAAEQLAHVLRETGAKVLVAEDGAYLARVLEAFPAAMTSLLCVVVLEEARMGAVSAEAYASLRERTVSWRALLAEGAASGDAGAAVVRGRAAAVRAADLLTILYTSGASGAPRGVMLTHRNFVFEAKALASALEVGPTDLHLLVLPLSHVFGRILLAVQMQVGCVTAFAESLARAMDNAAEIKPTLLACVPRLFERVHAAAEEGASRQGRVRRSVFVWASSVARAAARAEEQGGEVQGALAFERQYADKLVFKAVRARFGGRLRFAVCGGAPLATDIGEWFRGAGIPLLEGYGLTETTGVTSVSRLDRYRAGAVGPALPGVELRIGDGGEVLVRGPHVMLGYWNREDETRAAFHEGFLRSGDLGEIDAHGILTITDRKKDMIVLKDGSTVAPRPIEQLLERSPWIRHAVLSGEGRPHLVGLLALRTDALVRFANEAALPFELSGVADHPAVQARVQREVDSVNETLGTRERVARFALLPRELSVEAGELTPTFKVRRKVVIERYRSRLDPLYE